MNPLSRKNVKTRKKERQKKIQRKQEKKNVESENIVELEKARNKSKNKIDEETERKREVYFHLRNITFAPRETKSTKLATPPCPLGVPNCIERDGTSPANKLANVFTKWL